MSTSDFDGFSRDYDDILGSQLQFFGAESDYFAEYKVELTRRLVGGAPASILDFGCGIGRSVKHFARYFPGSTVVGMDVSEGSLDVARRDNAGVAFYAPGTLPPSLRFDLIFAAGVFHHIAPGQRLETLQACANWLSPAGHLVVFEHNPYNPVTRRIVRLCPFDRDAHLVQRRELVSLARRAGLAVRHAWYTLFFPGALGWMRPLERYLTKLPLGGQYLVHACRSAGVPGASAPA
jgi:SAM-dependent methyltransferase